MAKRTAARPKKAKTSKSSSLGRIFLGFVIVVLVMLTGIGCGFLTASMNTKPDLGQDLTPSASSHIYDINGNEIANIHATEDRTPVKLSQIPKDLQNAFVAVEDARFYEHSGIDPRGILRALWANITDRAVSEGGSTITQQLAKNAYLTQERTIKRKVQEMFLALQLEREYTKQEILEFYLNQIYFGEGAYGVQAAAKTYFGKDVSALTLNECALLAGIPKSPNYYSPFNNMEAAKLRKNTVLEQMEKYHYIGSTEAKALKQEELKFAKPQPTSALASYFIEFVKQTVIDKYGADAIYKNGLKIYTTIDMDMQRQAEEAMKLLPTFETDKNGLAQPQGALVAIDPHTGQIKAMVGGRGTDQFNRATMAERQPGSAFKPFVFVAALENRFTPNTIIEDSPIEIDDWEPQNYNRNFNGKVTLRYIAEQSLNVPTVKIAQKIGMDKPIYYAQEMGITTFVLDGPMNDRGLATSLGGLTRGLTPLELTSAYGTFANKGVHVEPTAIIKILDRNGQVVEQVQPKQKNVISEVSAADLTDMLRGVLTHGTGTGAAIDRPAAGKTGTTSDYCDAWFVGYTTDLVAGVWVGCDDNSDLDGMTGGNLPATIWREFMSEATAKMPVRDFEGASGHRGDTVNELKEDGAGKQNRQRDQRQNPRPGQRQNQQPGQRPNQPAGRPQQNRMTPPQPVETPARETEREREREREREKEPTRPTNPTPSRQEEPEQPERPTQPTRPTPTETPSPTIPTSPSMSGGMGKGR
ncbi:MAG: penicillin-binding protein 1A [Schwartzia sp.]|nr:penicillin-binding protein 1A [Schwartzia sp. (in: firmicutes)]